MSTLDFFNRNFGRHLVAQTGDGVADATLALSSSHPMAKGTVSSRISYGWGIISDAGSTIQCRLAATGLSYGTQTRYDAWLDALESFDGRPIMLLEFDKKLLTVSNLFRTHDLRAVHVCAPNGVDVFDYTVEPTKTSCKPHRRIWEAKLERLKPPEERTPKADDETETEESDV